MRLCYKWLSLIAKTCIYKFKNISFSLFFVEKGGAFPNDEESFAQIICDYEGGKIFPIKKIREGNRANRIHAWFLGNDLCVVNAYKENRQSKFKIIHYVVDKHTGVLTEELLYEGRFKHRHCMPKSLQRFNDAIDAASNKMKDYQCTRIYYSL